MAPRAEQGRSIKKENDKHSVDENSICTGTAQPPASPPTATQISSWQQDASLVNTQLQHGLHLEQQLSGLRG